MVAWVVLDRLHYGHSSTPLQSIPYALFLSRRRVYPLLVLPSRPRSLLSTHYPPQVLSFHTLAHSFAHFCIFLHSPKTQLPCFQLFPYSLQKTTRGGVPLKSPARSRGQAAVVWLGFRPIL